MPNGEVALESIAGRSPLLRRAGSAARRMRRSGDVATCFMVGSVGDPRAVIDRLTAAQNAHDLEGMVACFHEDYLSEQPVYPARTFQGVDQVRENWSTLLQGIPDFHADVLRSAVEGDTVFVEISWTGTKTDGTVLEERGVLIMGIRDNRIAWGRLYVDEVEREGSDIDAVVGRMAGTEDR